MRTKTVAMLAILTVIAVASLPAANRYVRAGAAGANNGSDWTNAWTQLPGSLVRSDTYYVADGTYGGLTLDDAESGTALITIRKATVADHGTATGWQDAYGDGQAVFSGWSWITRDYYLIDGQGRSGWKSGHGIKLTSPGDSMTVRLDDTSGATNMNSGAHYISFRYVEFDGSGFSTADAMYSLGLNTNLTVQYCYFHDYSRTHILSRGWDTVTVENTYFLRNQSSPEIHGESWSDMNSNNITVRYNYWEDCEGTGIIFTRTDPNSSPTSNWQVYGNVIFWTPGYSSEGVSGFLQLSSRMQNTRVYNNTIYNGKGIYQGVMVYSTGLSVDVKVYNNIWWNCEDARHGGIVGSGLDANYNFYYNSPHNAEAGQQQWSGGSIFSNPAVGDFHLNQATATGVNLPSPYNLDLDIRTRGADGVWDRGALEYTGSPAVLPPAAPKNLRAGG